MWPSMDLLAVYIRDDLDVDEEEIGLVSLFHPIHMVASKLLLDMES